MQHDIASEHVAHTLRCRLGCYHPVNVLALPKHVYSIKADGYIVSESLGETTQYISWVLVCLSCLGLVISALLLGLVLTLFMVENKKENELLETLGFEGRQRRRVAMTTLWVLDARFCYLC